MNEQALIDFVLHQAALPLALLAVGYSIVTYRSGRVRTKIGRVLSREAAPFRFWFEVVGALAVAVVLSLTGSLYLLGRA